MRSSATLKICSTLAAVALPSLNLRSMGAACDRHDINMQTISFRFDRGELPDDFPDIDQFKQLPWREQLSVYTQYYTGPAYEELCTLTSLEGALEFYRARGEEFEDQQSFLDNLELDWVCAVFEEIERARCVESPEWAEPIRVDLDEASYEIYGISHSDNYLELIRARFGNHLSDEHPVLAEQNLGPFIDHPDVRELNDHEVNDLDLERYPREVGTQEKEDQSRSLNARAHEEGSCPDQLKSIWITKTFLHYFKQQIPDIQTLFSMPIEIYSAPRYPMGVNFDLGASLGVPMDSNLARSAFMAEVMRRWDYSGLKRVVVGAAHAAEIAYFLKNPCKNPDILKMAEEHAERLNSYSPTLGKFHSLSDDAFTLIPIFGAPFLLGLSLGLGVANRRLRKLTNEIEGLRELTNE